MKERIIKKLTDSEDSINLVKENIPKNYKKFMEMEKLERDGIYKNIEFSIQNILDICAMIAKDKKLDIPENDSDLLEELKKAKLLEKSTVDRIKELKGFRNYLVHRYGDLDDEVAYDDIIDGLKDFKAIFSEIKKIIQ